jgi:cell division protease FtsH
MAVALGGRIAEELIYGEDEITTGASNDIQQVTNTAKMMVTRFGMSEKVGQVALAAEQGSPFLGRQMGMRQSPMSAETRALIDSEVSRLVNEAYAKAKSILVENREVLDKLATLLVEKETVTAEEFQQLLTECQVKIGSYGVYA